MKRRFGIVVALLASGCAAANTPPAKTQVLMSGANPKEEDRPVDRALEQKLDEVALQVMKQGPVLGMQVLVRKGDNALLSKSYGFASLEKSKAVDEATRFGIGSMTKQLTAAAVLQLVDKGKLSLGDPVSKYLPEVSAPITIAQLLNQTTGLVDFSRPDNLSKDRAGITSMIARSTPAFPPGSTWRYSNSNYYLLGRVIEVVSGHTYGDYLAQEIFARLGMRASSYCMKSVAGVAQGSAMNGDSLGAAESIDPDFFFAAGGVCSTSADMSRWQTALFEGKVLTPSSLAFMTSPAKPTDGSACSYGAGVVVDTVHGHRRFWHNGALPSGFESEMSFFPDDQLEIVVLSNTLHSEAGMVMGKLDRALAITALGYAADDARESPSAANSVLDLPLPSDAPSRYEGTFALGPVTTVLSIKDGKVHSLVNGKNDLLLLYQGNDTFIVSVNHRGVYRFVIKDGHGVAIDLVSNGDALGQLTRVPSPH